MRVLFRSVPLLAVYGFLVASCGLRSTLDSEGADSSARASASPSGKLDALAAPSFSNSSPDAAFVSDLGPVGMPDLNDRVQSLPVLPSPDAGVQADGRGAPLVTTDASREVPIERDAVSLSRPEVGVSVPPPSDGGARPIGLDGGIARPVAPDGGGGRPTTPDGGLTLPVAPDGGLVRPAAPDGGFTRPQRPDGGLAQPGTDGGFGITREVGGRTG